jgi:hypothetical protein
MGYLLSALITAIAKGDQAERSGEKKGRAWPAPEQSANLIRSLSIQNGYY